jgi:hypothetical protein
MQRMQTIRATVKNYIRIWGHVCPECSIRNLRHGFAEGFLSINPDGVRSKLFFPVVAWALPVAQATTI